MSEKNTVTISPAESKLFGEMLWNSLAETRADQWSDFPWVIQVFCKVAHTYQLEAVMATMEDDSARLAIGTEIQRRSHLV